ncbi:MAG: PIN domain-containing protein [Acidobacteria bacterium]|nr:MAG: PIN domain-containing protein [Acidobacteriota bacterium]
MIAVDANILVYAHRRDSPFHEVAASVMTTLAEQRQGWAIPWPCVHEFFAIVTHRRIFKQPSPVKTALGQLKAWLESPSLALLSESDGYWEKLSKLLESSRITGARVHDARIAALCLHHSVERLWTADRDFSRFPELVTENPLVS